MLKYPSLAFPENQKDYYDILDFKSFI